MHLSGICEGSVLFQKKTQEISGGYKGIWREILRDLKLQKIDYDDTEVLTRVRSISNVGMIINSCRLLGLGGAGPCLKRARLCRTLLDWPLSGSN
jgi:hypothetical protein